MESCTDEDQKESLQVISHRKCDIGHDGMLLQVASQCLTEGFGIDIEDEEQQRKYAVRNY